MNLAEQKSKVEKLQKVLQLFAEQAGQLTDHEIEEIDISVRMKAPYELESTTIKLGKHRMVILENEEPF